MCHHCQKLIISEKKLEIFEVPWRAFKLYVFEIQGVTEFLSPKHEMTREMRRLAFAFYLMPACEGKMFQSV